MGPKTRHTEPVVVTRYVIVAAMMAAVIMYGSLYPFHFRMPHGGAGAVVSLLLTWNHTPGRGDFLANILLYLPLGFFATLALPGLGRPARIAIPTLIGLALCVTMELAQHCDPGRDSSMTDVYSNILGTALGATGGIAFGGIALRLPFLEEMRGKPVPVLLLIAWLGFRLFPYVPTIDLHKYWNALKPLVLTPTLTSYGLYRYTAMWIVVAALVEMMVGRRRMWLAFPFVIGCVMFARILVISTELRVAEVLGALIAYVYWLSVGAARLALGTALLCLLIAIMRLEPFRMSPYPHAFNWIPFHGFMFGSLSINMLSFMEKFFYYGSAIWLMTELGFRLRGATMLVALLLLLTSAAEIFLVGHSPEITDATMAVIIGVVFGLVRPRQRFAA